MHIKEQIRIIGWDDGPFSRNRKKCLLIGCVMRGHVQIDGILRTYIEVDGIDATEKISTRIINSKFRDVKIIMLDGITFGGFNIVNIKTLYELTGIPVIVVNRKMPDKEEFMKAMKKLPQYRIRAEAVKDAGKIYSVKIENRGSKGKIYYQKYGISKKDAEKVIKISIYTSLFPEPVRIAHLIATGVVFGESIGRV